MAEFKSKPATINSSVAAVIEKFSDFSNLQEYIDKLPEAERAKIGDIALTRDTIVLKTPQVGEITLKVTERTPEHIKLSAVGSPVPMELAVNLKPVDSDHTELVTSMNVDIPVFLKPMIGGTLQKAVDQFGELMKRFA